MIEQPAPAPDLWNMHRSAPRRSLLLCGLGAIVGLAIAGFGLFTAQGTRTANVPAEDAALVNNVPILRADLIQQVMALSGGDWASAPPARRRKVLDDMIREELAVQRGVEIGLANDDADVRRALVAATEGQIAQDAMTARPAESELRAWYLSHRASYAGEGTMTLHEYVLPSGARDPQRIVAALRAGASAASLGLKPSGRVDDGEEFYFAAQLHLGRLFPIARALRDGDVSDPIGEKDGVHILQMVHNQQPVATPYEEAHDRVLQDFLGDKVARLQAGSERFLRKRADVKIAADLR